MLRFLVRERWRSRLDRVLRRPSREERALAHVLRSVGRPDPDAVLAALDAFARRERFLFNVGDEKGPILDRAVEQRAPTRALEIGAYVGYSAVRIAARLPAGGTLVSIEAEPDFARIARSVIARAGLGDRVTVLHGRADEVLPTLTDPFELVFLDHAKHRYLPDLELLEARGLLAPGVVIVADNVAQKDARPYLERVLADRRYRTEVIDCRMEYEPGIPDAIAVSVAR